MDKSTYLTTLTPLRGIAALLVVVFHVPGCLARLSAPGQTEFISMGWLWVDFFFILSGFILSHVYSDTFREGVTLGAFRRFMLARFARVYPLHLVTLVLTVGLVLLIKYLADGIMENFSWWFNLRTLPACLLLVQSMGLFGLPPLNGPSWSLSTEWWVYVLFPFLVRPFLNLKSVAKVGVLGLIVALYLVLMYWIAPQWGNRFVAELGFPIKPTLNLTADFGFFRCLAGFVLGMLVYELYRQQSGFYLLRRGWVFVVLTIVTFVGMHLGSHELLILSFFPLIILSAAYNTDWLKRLLDTRPLQRLGDWSFSIYLTHVPLIYVGYCLLLLNKPTSLSSIKELGYYETSLAVGWLYCLILVTATLLVSALMYEYVEVPARKYLNSRLSARRPASASVVHY